MARNAGLTQRIARQDAELSELRQFKTLALSRLAAQHENIRRPLPSTSQARTCAILPIGARGPATGSGP